MKSLVKDSTRHVLDGKLGAVGGDIMADRLQKMCLAQTDAAVDKEGIIGAGRRLGHCRAAA